MASVAGLLALTRLCNRDWPARLSLNTLRKRNAPAPGMQLESVVVGGQGVERTRDWSALLASAAWVSKGWSNNS